MSEAEASVVGGDAVALLEALRQQGADKADPVRFHFLTTLARRTQAQQGPARRVLEAKLAQGLDDYRQRMATRREQARAAARMEQSAKRSPLQELVALLRQEPLPEAADTPAPALASHAPHTELKAVSYFRDTWSRLALNQRVSQALEQEPENAGPLNSHLLILRALKLMRDTAPDYLNRFMSYADTLLWLDQVNGATQGGKSAPLEEDAKRKKPRNKAR